MKTNIKNQNFNGYRINKIYKIILFCFFTVVSIAPLRNTQVVYWSSYGLIMGAFCLLLVTSNIKINKYYIFWVLGFYSVVIASVLWAYNLNYTMDGIKNMFVVTTVFIFTSLLIKNEGNFCEILKLFVYSKIVMTVYILLFIDTSTLGVVRIGRESLGEEWNANNIGMNMAVAAFMAFVLSKEEESKKMRLFYYFIIGLMGTIVFLSGSRKALFILMFTIAMYAILNAKKNKFSKIVMVSVIGMIVIYLIMNIPFLYNIIGSRLDTMISKFTGYGVVDKSARTRTEMIEYGKYLFRKKPLLGYGVNNYRALYGGITGDYTYAHNNYIDLLVGTGVIGTILYYWGYVYILKKAIFKKDSLSVFATISIVTILIIEIGLVSYDSFYIQFLICLSFSAVRIKSKPNIKGEKIN